MRRFTFYFLAGLFLLVSLSSAQAQPAPDFQDDHDFADVADPLNDERFFHLERFFQLNIVGGLNIFTEGLGGTHSLGGLIGLSMSHFFDDIFAVEVGFNFSFQNNYPRGQEFVNGVAQNFNENSVTYLMVPQFAFRAYLPTAPLNRFFASLNPYGVLGFDWNIRRQTVRESNARTVGEVFTDNSVGFAFGCGTSSLIYGDSIYAGLDFRYHLTLFADEDTPTTTGFSRDGDYITLLATLTFDY